MRKFPRGFTIMEILVGSAVMLVVILGALAVYMRSNRISVDQQQYTEVQHDVRSGMYFITRDIRMAGAGMPIEFSAYFLEGVDNDTTDTQANVAPDRLKLIGNMDDPLNLSIQQYQGASVVLTVDDYSFEQYPYADSYYTNKIVLILPNPASACRAGEIRQITHVTHSQGGTNEKFNFSPGLAPGINPPRGLWGTCQDPDNYDGGMIMFINVKEYWLDVTGNYPGLTAGKNGYIGNGTGGILYLTHNGLHLPLAQNIENLQFQYNGDLDNDGALDGFRDWDNTWTPEEIGRIRQVRVWVLGRTPNPMVSVSGTPPSNIHLYRRPTIANSPGMVTDDLHRRFLLESTSNIRNLTLNIYNTDQR